MIFSEMFGPACPVKLLKRYLVHFSVPSSSRDLIFSPVSPGNNFFKLVSQDEPISYTTIREAFRKDLRSVGVDPSTFGFYSLPHPLLIMGLVTVFFSGSAAGSPS